MGTRIDSEKLEYDNIYIYIYIYIVGAQFSNQTLTVTSLGPKSPTQ